MAFTFLRYRNKYVILIMFALGAFFAFNCYILNKSSTILDITADTVIRTALLKIQRTEKEVEDTSLDTPSIFNKVSNNSFEFTPISLNSEYSLKNIPKSSRKAIKSTKNHASIINTPGCRIPKMDPLDPSVLPFIQVLDPLICSGSPLFMTPEPHGIVHLNESVLQKYYNSTAKDLECVYEGVRRIVTPEMDRENGIYKTTESQLVFDIPINEDNIAVKCFFKNNNTHEQYMPLTRLKEKVEEEKSQLKPSSQLNVILYGIDSVSKLNFLRHFRQTKSFLKDKINIFDMKGYTKVADNTFPNLVPLLTGHFVEFYWNESMADTFYFDNISLIWKDYAQQGYRTFFAEDAPLFGTFNYFKRGFLAQPTDYYYRPLALMLEHSTIKEEPNKYNSTCLNSELEMDLINNYLRNFVKTMDNRPHFAFAMHSTLTHDVLNYASYADAPTARLLKALDDDGSLNNTLLIMFSDHGIRYSDIRFTYIGKFEERMPFMYIHIPKWFLKQHPNIEKNLLINQGRLITLFDIHATLKHVLNLKQDLYETTDELGLSIFNEIPDSRTCEDANIRPHWCPCTSFDAISLNDKTVVNVAGAIVRHINEMLLPFSNVCSVLDLKEITDALRGLPNSIVLKFRGLAENNSTILKLGSTPPTLGDYLITLKTHPGDAMFESTVRYDEVSNIPNVLDISRINMYGKQSWCIDSPRLKLYCYCKTQIV
ncbi:uncharacterized protein [Parasteatoda tepidariorum]|uniref:uncharacterized protein n=1 Tax=Parasteatoda tepidariorum TaxID=114398 RepID=UPI001C71BED4|nr:uncharacterized protein LOC107456188 [Parasteatoda tepidariorum]